MNSRSGEIIKKVVIYSILLIASAIIIFPILWTLITSLKPEEMIMQTPVRYIPQQVTFEHYSYVWNNVNFPRYLLNSFFVAGTTSLICVIIGSLAAYGFSRFTFPGKWILMFAILGTVLIPGVILIIPYYFLMRTFGLLDTYPSLILPYIAFNIPFTVWMLTSYFRSVPKALDEAALIDGCNRIQSIFRIILPLTLPGIVTVFLFTFIKCWNEFILASVFINTDALKTATVGVYSFISQYATEWGPLTAGTIIVTIPVMILFAFIQRHIISGLTMGAVD